MAPETRGTDVDISAMDSADIQQLFDVDVVDADNAKVGTVEQIFADDVTGAATFVTVKGEDGAEYFLPVREATFVTHRLSVPFDRHTILSAPRAEGAAELSREQETHVYGHYGMEPARRSRTATEDAEAEPTRRDDTAGAEGQDGEVATAAGHGEADPAEDSALSVEGEQSASQWGERPDDEPEVADVTDRDDPRVEVGEEAGHHGPAGAEQFDDEADAAAFAPMGSMADPQTHEVAGAEDEWSAAEGQDPADSEAEEHDDSDQDAAEALGFPAGARLRTYTVTEMVTVQVPVTREVLCWQDAEGQIHHFETVDAPDKPRSEGSNDPHDPANWWFADDDGTIRPMG